MLNNLFSIKKNYKAEIILFFIILLAFYFRTFNTNWDNSYYFHPDERAIYMFTIPLAMPSSLTQFLSVDSPLNPHFFAYGSLPLYLLKIMASSVSFINPIFSEYGGIHIIGRLISATADTGTVFLVYLLGTKLVGKRGGLFAASIYACSVFPIQVSHFYAVDSLLTFFMTFTVYLLVVYLEKRFLVIAFYAGIFFGMALATKISSAILIVSIVLALFYKPKKARHLVRQALSAITLLITAGLVFVITQPYTLIDFRTFLQQTTLQSQMSNNAFLFPYTLQYVGKIPYLYEFKNIIFWGQGLFIAPISFLGIASSFLVIKLGKDKKIPLYIFLIISTGVYFMVFGKFAVGWMRYMLPIYPLLAVFGGIFLDKAYNKFFKNSALLLKRVALFMYFIVLISYPFSFLTIYTKPTTKIQASDWIHDNIPQGSKLAVEHWDDSLPIYGGEKYTHLTLPLYDPDTSTKWLGIKSTLQVTDYIIIASNRLYVPLQKLTDCERLPFDKCYKLTSQYYKNLFDGKLGFRKVAEFSSYPTVPILNLQIIDDSADESFTVYDHPKIFIFERIDLGDSTH